MCGWISSPVLQTARLYVGLVGILYLYYKPYYGSNIIPAIQVSHLVRAAGHVMTVTVTVHMDLLDSNVNMVRFYFAHSCIMHKYAILDSNVYMLCMHVYMHAGVGHLYACACVYNIMYTVCTGQKLLPFAIAHKQ